MKNLDMAFFSNCITRYTILVPTGLSKSRQFEGEALENQWRASWSSLGQEHRDFQNHPSRIRFIPVWPARGRCRGLGATNRAGRAAFLGAFDDNLFGRASSPVR